MLGDEGRGLAGCNLRVSFSQGGTLGSNEQSGQRGYTAVLLLLCCAAAFREVDKRFIQICRRCSEGVSHDPLPEA